MVVIVVQVGLLGPFTATLIANTGITDAELGGAVFFRGIATLLGLLLFGRVADAAQLPDEPPPRSCLDLHPWNATLWSLCLALVSSIGMVIARSPQMLLFVLIGQGLAYGITDR